MASDLFRSLPRNRFTEVDHINVVSGGSKKHTLELVGILSGVSR